MRKCIAAIVLIVIFQHGFAQNVKIDSLYNVLKTEIEDTNKANTLNKIATSLLLHSNYPTSDSFARQALSLSQKLSFKPGMALAYKVMGGICYYRGKYTEAIKYQEQSLKLNEELNNKKNMGTLYGNIGAIYEELGNYEESFKYLLQSLKIGEMLADSVSIGRAEGNIGNIYVRQGNYPEALKYLLLSLAIDEEIKNKPGIALAYGNIGNVYYGEKKFDEGIKNYSLSLKMDEETGNKYGMALAYGNIGNINYDEGKYVEALNYQLKSLEIDKQINAMYGIALAYANIGNVYYRQSKYADAIGNYSKAMEIDKSIGDKRDMAGIYIFDAGVFMDERQFFDAKKYLDSALNIASVIGVKEVIRDYYFDKKKLDSVLGDFKKALEDYSNYIVYRDSIVNDQNTQKIVSEQMTYDFEKKETQLKEQEDEQNAINHEKIKRQKLITWASVGTLGFMLLFSVLLFSRSRLKQKNEYQTQLNERQKEQALAVMETQELERKRIAEDLHDGLGYLLSTVKLNLQTQGTDQKNGVQESLKYVNQASQEIHNITFNLMPRTLEEEGLVPALRELVNRVANSGSVKIMLHLFNVDDLVLEKQTQFMVYRIVQEAINNILKYAGASEVNIQLTRQENNLVVMVEDDGKGFNVEQVKKGRGLKNMTARSEWLNGKLSIDSTEGRGTTIITEIPVLAWSQK